ncbi:Non-specific serine/threonine protein kinase [Bertholletia excelsa]
MTGEVPGTSAQKGRDDLGKVVSVDEYFADKDLRNISVQTGEEFSPEFLRVRAIPRRIPKITDLDQKQVKRMGFNFKQNNQLGYEDHASLLGIRKRDSKSGIDVLGNVPEKFYAEEVDQQGHSNMVSRHCRSISANAQLLSNFSDEVNYDKTPPGPSVPPFHVSGSPHSSDIYGYCSGLLDGSFSGNMKFLCSFGGRILSRPNDGKLRYVGGETRMISIRRNLNYSELLKKTWAICNQPHVIKYQLPGEDLDALISVSSDEDLHNMIEEYYDLERRCKRLRIFLLPLAEADSSGSFELQPMQQNDSNYQYVVPVCGMMDPSCQLSTGGRSVSSQTSQMGSLDYSPTFQRESATSFHPTDIRDGGSSPNLRQMHSNAAVQFFNTPPTATKTYSQSPPPSSVLVQRREHMNLQMQQYEDDAISDAHEKNSPFVMDHRAYESTNHVEATNHYYNQSQEPLPVMNNQYHNKRLMEWFQNHIPSNDFVSSPLYGQGDVEFGKHTPNEIGLQSEIVISSPVGSPNSMFHVRSDSQLQREERSRHYLEKTHSLAPSSFAKEIKTKNPEKIDENYYLAKNENMATFWPGDHIQEYYSRQDMLTWIDKKPAPFHQDAEFRDENGSLELHADSEEHIIIKSCANLNPLHKLQVTRGTNPACPSSILSDSAKTTREHPNDHNFGSVVPQFVINSPKIEKDQQDAENKIMSGETGWDGYPRLRVLSSQDITGCETEHVRTVNLTELAGVESGSITNLDENEPLVPHVSTQIPGSNVVSGTKISLLEEDPVRFGQVTEFGHASFIKSEHSDIQFENNASDLTVIIEDVTDCLAPNVPLSSTIVPRVQNEPSDKMPSPRETDTGSVAPESDVEDAEVDGKEKDKAISDVLMAEMEAGIYGLQIIKNADLEDLQELGSGTFGTVYHGKWRGTDVAIKRIKKSYFSGRSSEQEHLTKDFWREAQILSKLHHPNVVAFYGVVPDGPGGTLATVTEFMSNGSLRHVLLQKDRKALDQRKKLILAMDAAFGMEYLHLKNIVHFDLKCDNLLVNLGDPHRPICKVGDFGLSRIKRNTFVSGGVRGTLPWMAPELLNGSRSRVSEKVDVFSFGITIWEMLTGEEPYADMHCGAIIGGILSNSLRPPIPENCNPEWTKLMEDCWEPDPEARPSFTEIANRLREMSKALQPKRYNLAKR